MRNKEEAENTACLHAARFKTQTLKPRLGTALGQKSIYECFTTKVASQTFQ